MLCLFLLCTDRAEAQIFKGFVSGGMTVSQIDGDEVYGFKKVAPTIGLGAMVPLNTNNPNGGFQLSLEINYSRRGARETTSGDPFEYNANLDYIDIPIMIHYVDTKGGVALGAGLQYSVLFHSSEKWVLPDTLIFGMDRPTMTDSKFKRGDLALVGDLRFTIWRKLKCDVRYQYSLLPIREDFEFNNSYRIEDNTNYRTWLRDFKNSSVTVKLIYMINEEQEQVFKSNKRRSR